MALNAERAVFEISSLNRHKQAQCNAYHRSKVDSGEKYHRYYMEQDWKGRDFHQQGALYRKY